jgi:hypothetical protein
LSANVLLAPANNQEQPMTQLFNRASTERIPNAGERAHRYTPKCWKCGGAGGAEAWRYTGWTCYACGGTGLGLTRIEKLYTREELDVLDARLQKRRDREMAKRVAAQAIVDAERAERRAAFLAEHAEILAKLDELVANERKSRPEWKDEQGVVDFWADVHDGIRTRVKLSEAQATMIDERHAEMLARRAATERKQKAGWIGNINQRLKGVRAKVVMCKHIGVNRDFYPPRNRYLVRLETEAGHSLTWWTDHVETIDEEFVEVSFTVKDHDEYQGVPQTVVQRVTFKQAAVAA